jgi:hypothetical protein
MSNYICHLLYSYETLHFTDRVYLWVSYCDVFTGYSDTNLPRVRVSATSN